MVDILGVRPNLEDYPPQDVARIQDAETILYPTRHYAQPLENAGKKVFPRACQYYYLGNKIRQTTLFKLKDIPMPRSRIFYGRQGNKVFQHFQYPFVAKLPRAMGEGRGVFLINNDHDWRAYLNQTHVAYVQEYIPLDRDLRVVAVAGRLVTAYWRRNPTDFRHNISQGGIPDFNNVPPDGIAFALDVIDQCGFDDVGLDVFHHQGQWMVLEANMHYGLQGLRLAGVSLAKTIDNLILEERI
jgi:ribosomal protein S6--L-glutamate ligase